MMAFRRTRTTDSRLAALTRCFGLAALAILPIYERFALGHQSIANYYRPSPFPLLLAGVWLGALTVLGITCFAIVAVVQRLTSETVKRIIFAASALLLMPSAWILITSPSVRWAVVALLATTCVACALSASASHVAAAVLQIFAAIVPIQIASVAWDYFGQPARQRFVVSRGPSAVRLNAPIPAAHTSDPGRIVWLVFDEMDDELTFALRPASIQLPALDAFRSEAVYVTGAKPAGADTLVSMPSMLLGKRLKNVQVVDFDTLRMSSGDSKQFGWRGEQSVFSDAQAAGLKTAIVGWYHPYCRILGPEVDVCENYFPPDPIESIRYEAMFRRHGVFGFLRRGLQTHFGSTSIGPTLFGSEPLGKSAFRPDRASIHTAISDSAARLAVDSNIGLTVIHDNVPHQPGIYDRVRNRMAWRDDSNYFDNLELVDSLVARIRSAMTAAGMWDATTVIVTSDHPLREQLWRGVKHQWTEEEELLVTRRRRKAIPFIIKLAGQREGLTIDSNFDAVRTRDLLTAIRKGEISSHAGVAAWINANERAGMQR